MVGLHGRSGLRATVAVGGASRNAPVAALTPPLSMEDCHVMDRPFRNWPAPHFALVSESCIYIYIVPMCDIVLCCIFFMFYFTLPQIFLHFFTPYTLFLHVFFVSHLSRTLIRSLQWTVCGQSGVSGRPVGPSVPNGGGGSATTQHLKTEERTAMGRCSTHRTAPTVSACKVS